MLAGPYICSSRLTAKAKPENKDSLKPITTS